MLHPKADELLLKIYKAYASTGSRTIQTSDILADQYDDSFFYELENADYIKFHNTIAPYVEVLDKTISFAKSQKLI